MKLYYHPRNTAILKTNEQFIFDIVVSIHPSNKPFCSTSTSYHGERGSGLLQQSHQTDLGKVFARANALFIWRHHVIGDGRFLQHVRGNVLRCKLQAPTRVLCKITSEDKSKHY